MIRLIFAQLREVELADEILTNSTLEEMHHLAELEEKQKMF